MYGDHLVKVRLVGYEVPTDRYLWTTVRTIVKEFRLPGVLSRILGLEAEGHLRVWVGYLCCDVQA